MKLSIKQENFCNYYIETGNASDAYRRSYNCKGWKDKSVWEKSSVLLANVKVMSRVKELREEVAKKSTITKEKVLAEFAKVGFSTIAHLHNSWIEQKGFDKLTEDQKACIKSISTRVEHRVTNEEPVEVSYVKIELYDKLRALDSINKMLGYNEPTKMDINHNLLDVDDGSDE